MIDLNSGRVAQSSEFTCSFQLALGGLNGDDRTHCRAQ
jgi:hypothetical protein